MKGRQFVCDGSRGGGKRNENLEIMGNNSDQ